MWVRFPNGQCIQYNDATYASRNPNGYTDLYTAKSGGTWVAQVPNTCVIEAVAACRVWNPLNKTPAVVENAERQPRSIRRAIGKKR